MPLALLPALLLPPLASGIWGLLGGVALVLLGLYFRIAGVRMIGGQARIHSGGARYLISSGIFARVRNPLYIGNTFVVGGGAALLFSPWSAPLAMGYLFLLYTVVALYEEKCLADQMGTPFLEYLESVPRWIPRLKPYTPPADREREPTMPWSKVLRNERWFIGCCLSLIVLGLLLHDRFLLFLHESDRPSAFRLVLPAVLVVVSAVLFARIARRLRRKRGSWLRVERIAGVDEPVQGVE
jgi:protein-S-isoprenylcysteine O-methyltransferase Ste14